MGRTCRIQVAVRLRPLVEKEKTRYDCTSLHFVHFTCPHLICSASICKASGSTVVVQANGKSADFNFDRVFAPSATNMQIYQTICKDLIQGVFEGFNATIFAYGQTGSGKTFTMGSISCEGLEEGIISLAVDDIFEKKRAVEEQGGQLTVQASYLEVYKEDCFDLLSTGGTSTKLKLGDINGETVAIGLTLLPVQAKEGLMAILAQATSSRATGSTDMNEKSSRSHAICTLTLRIQESATSDIMVSKLHLVDLAGSERADKTNATGERFKEGVNINMGLLELGKVIKALSSHEKNVSYRGSKLTRLLKDALGGNGLTVMLACVSPAEVNAVETMSTLRFADMTSVIVNTARVNVQERSQDLAEALVENAALRQRNAALELAITESRRGESTGSMSASFLRALRSVLTRCVENGVDVDDAQIAVFRSSLLVTDRKTDELLDYVPPLLLLVEDMYEADMALQCVVDEPPPLSLASTGATGAPADGVHAPSVSALSETTSARASDASMASEPSMFTCASRGSTSRDSSESELTVAAAEAQITLEEQQEESDLLAIAASSKISKVSESAIAQVREKAKLLATARREIEKKEKELDRADRERAKAREDLCNMKCKAEDLMQERKALVTKLKVEHSDVLKERKRADHTEGQSKRMQNTAKRDISKLESQMEYKERNLRMQLDASQAESKRLREIVRKQQEIRASSRAAKAATKLEDTMSDEKEYQIREYMSSLVKDQIERTQLQETITAYDGKRTVMWMRYIQATDASLKETLLSAVQQMDLETSSRQQQLLDNHPRSSESGLFSRVRDLAEMRVILDCLYEMHIALAVRSDSRHMNAIAQVQRIRIPDSARDDAVTEYSESELATELGSEKDEDYEASAVKKPGKRKHTGVSRDTETPKRKKKSSAAQVELPTPSQINELIASSGDSWLHEYTVPALKSLLKSLGLSSTGNKGELIQRIFISFKSTSATSSGTVKTGKIRLRRIEHVLKEYIDEE